MFNALKYTQELEKAGFTRDQADVSIRLLIDAMNESFATKSDIQILSMEMKAADQSIRSDIQTLRSDMQSIEYRLTIKLGTMMTMAIGVAVTLVKLI